MGNKELCYKEMNWRELVGDKVPSRHLYSIPSANFGRFNAATPAS